MKKEELLETLNKIPNGRMFKISWSKKLPTYKGVNDTVIKTVNTTARKGIDYTHTGYYKSKVLNNNPNNPIPKKEEVKLQWGHWVEKNLIIGHTNKEGIYKEYLRLYTTINKPMIIYTCNGEVVNKEDLKGIVTATGLRGTKIEICYTIPIENIVSIGR